MSTSLARKQAEPGACPSGLRLEIHDRLEPVREEWQRFQRDAAASPHQSFEWVSAWLDRSEEGRAQELRIVVGRDPAGRCLFLLPFGIRRHRGCRVLEWLGGDQGNYASGLFCRAAWGDGKAPDFTDLWSTIMDRIGPVDAVHLADQPEDLAGIANPLAALPRIPAAGAAHWFALRQDWEDHYNRAFSSKSRRKLRRAEGELAAHGDLTFAPVDLTEERVSVLRWIMECKRERFRELGIADMFADAGTRAFYGSLVALPHREACVSVRLHAMRCGGELVAANLGLVHQRRFYGLVIGTTNGPLRDHEPGKHLFRRTVALCAGEGITVFDGGVGEDSYKLRWCTEERRLFHTLMPVTAAGRAYVLIANLELRAKTTIKTTPRLWSGFQRVRRLFTSSTAAAGKGL